MGGIPGKAAGATQPAADPFRVKRRGAAPDQKGGDLAWAAVTHIASGGFWVEPGRADSVGIIAVSVHEHAPADIASRVELLLRVHERCRRRVEGAQASLWVFPGGYFGHGWRGLDMPRLHERLADVILAMPKGTVIVTGADTGEHDQQVWVVRARVGQAEIQMIRRHHVPLPGRAFQVGGLRGAAFVCGEFTGSATKANGPYFGNDYLLEPASALSECDVLVDVAHRRVRGSVQGKASPRMVHQLQMERFAGRGAAVLTHHHGGERRDGRAKADCASNWVIHRGGEWLDPRHVVHIQ